PPPVIVASPPRRRTPPSSLGWLGPRHSRLCLLRYDRRSHPTPSRSKEGSPCLLKTSALESTSGFSKRSIEQRVSPRSGSSSATAPKSRQGARCLWPTSS